MPRRIVVSGCSGGGKTTLIDEMAQRGYATIPEPGRRVVAEALATGGTALPWQNPGAFAERALDVAIADHASAGDGVTVFDRATLDALNWFDQTGTPLPDRFRNCAETLRYDQVFLVPPWPEIFAQDAARRHDMATALAEYDALLNWLPRQGYPVHIIPRAPIPERADWLEAALAAAL